MARLRRLCLVKAASRRARRPIRRKTAAILASRLEEWGRSLAEDVESVLKRYPEADPDDVRLTLIALELSPWERLNRSLRRGQGFAAFRR